MPSPGSARTVGTKMGSGINDAIADFRFRISELRNSRKLTTEGHGIARKKN